MEKTTSEDGWSPLLDLLAKVDHPKKMKKLLNLFLTIEEKETLASRYLIVKALLEGQLTQREISDHYEVSISQITRGSNALKTTDGDIKKLIEKHNAKEKPK